MWELDHKKGWALKNWCFQTVVLVKTLESPSNNIKPVKPKGNQPWIFIERTDAEAPLLWPPDEKNQLIGKDPDAGKDWGQEEKRVTRGKMVGWNHWLNRHEFEQAPGDSEGQGSLACCSPWDGERVTGRKARGLQRRKQATSVRHFFYLSLKQQEETNYKCQIFFFFFSQWMLHEEATTCVAVAQPLWLVGTYDPRDRLEKPVFLYLFVSCPPSHPVFNHP